MQFQNSAKLEAYWAQNEIAVAFFYGEDSYQLEATIQKLVKPTALPFPNFNFYQVDGRSGVDMDKIADAVQSLPVMAPRRIVLLDDLDLSALSTTDVQKLWQLLQDPTPTTLLLITVRTLPLDIKKKSSRGKKLLELCDQKGVICHFARPTHNDLAHRAVQQAMQTERHLEFSQGLLLAEYCGFDSLRIYNEVKKLCAYTQKEICRKDILLLVEPVREARVFELSSHILRGDLRSAIEVVDSLLFCREAPVSILTMLAMAFVDVYRAACARADGLSEQEAIVAFGYSGSSSYRYRRALEHLKQINLCYLKQILATLAQADREMKTSGVDAIIVLETTVIELFLILNGGNKF